MHSFPNRVKGLFPNWLSTKLARNKPQLPDAFRMHCDSGLDLVDCGDVLLFMMSNDNLYNLCIPNERRNISLDEIYAEIKNTGYRRPPVDEKSLLKERKARYCIYKIIDHMLTTTPGFTCNYPRGAFAGAATVVGSMIGERSWPLARDGFR